MSLEQAYRLAGEQIGLNEGQQNAALREYLRNGGENLDPATTAWCASFVNATLKQSGMEGTGKLNARSYLDWGESVDTPQPGDIAVFSRGDPNGWQGHVGFFQGYDENGNILVLGGNQGDAVSVAPYSSDRLLGFRRATDGTAQPAQAPQETGNALAAMSPREEPQNSLARYQGVQNDPRAFMAPTNQLALMSYDKQSNPFLRFLS